MSHVVHSQVKPVPGAHVDAHDLPAGGEVCVGEGRAALTSERTRHVLCAEKNSAKFFSIES